MPSPRQSYLRVSYIQIPLHTRKVYVSDKGCVTCVGGQRAVCTHRLAVIYHIVRVACGENHDHRAEPQHTDMPTADADIAQVDVKPVYPSSTLKVIIASCILAVGLGVGLGVGLAVGLNKDAHSIVVPASTGPPVAGHCRSYTLITELEGYTGCAEYRLNDYFGSWALNAGGGERCCGQNATGSHVNGTYIGSVVNGRFEGQGTLAFSNGDVYSGSWANGAWDGIGVLTRCESCGIWDSVISQWDQGSELGATTQVFKRWFCIDQLVGMTSPMAQGALGSGFYQGVFNYSNGAWYVGEMLDSQQGIQLHGYGILDVAGEQYAGVWVHDRFDNGTLQTDATQLLGCCTKEGGFCM